MGRQVRRSLGGSFQLIVEQDEQEKRGGDRSWPIRFEQSSKVTQNQRRRATNYIGCVFQSATFPINCLVTTTRFLHIFCLLFAVCAGYERAIQLRARIPHRM